MSEHTSDTAAGQDREGARQAMRDLPGETALGHVDPASVDDPAEAGEDIAPVATEKGFPMSDPALTRDDEN